MKSKKIVWALLCLVFPLLGKAQVAIGTNHPNASAELILESNSRGFIMPRIALHSLQDTHSIKAGNIESLILYNTTSNSELSPGYYYWAYGKWNRIALIEDIPLIVIQELEKVFTNTVIKEFLLELIEKTSGNVWFKDNTLYYKDEQDIEREIKLEQDLTILSYDSVTGVLAFLDENKNTTTLDLKQVVEGFQGVSLLKVDYKQGLLHFEDQNNQASTIDLKRIVWDNQKKTSLENMQNGIYTFTNEDSETTTIDVISDIQRALEDKKPISLDNALNSKIAEQQSLTSLQLDTVNNILLYKDEHNKVNNVDLKPLLKGSYDAIILDTITSKHVKISQRLEDNTKYYSLNVPIATKQSQGVIKPGAGLQIDQEGILEVDSQEISLEDLSGILSLDQLVKGNKGQVLSVNNDGDIAWLNQSIDIENSLDLEGNKLVSNVQGTKASVDLTSKITTDMLRNFAVTRFKISSDIAGPGLIKNPNTGVLEVDFKEIKDNLTYGNISTNSLTILGDSDALLGDLEINIKHGLANQILVTNNFGSGVEWRDSSKLLSDFKNEISFIDNILKTKVNEVEAWVNLTNKISNSMLRDESVSVHKLDLDFVGEGLKVNFESNSLEVDINRISEHIKRGDIQSKTLEVKRSSQENPKDVLLEIKPGKANQVLITSADESGVEWVNANTLICKDTFAQTTRFTPGTTALNNQRFSSDSKSSNSLQCNAIFIYQYSFSVLPTQQIQEINLYSLYQESFGTPLIQSNTQSTVQELKASEIDYFVTKMDQDYLEVVSLSKEGVLSFKAKDSAKKSSVSSLNLVFRLK
ncbi:hypothetical protein ACYSNX_05625 [Myroides sp. LJL115]